MIEIPHLEPGASLSKRNLEEYRDGLPADFFDNLNGQNILEYGPGTDEVYAYHCAQSGAEVTVVSPSYLNLPEFHSHLAHTKGGTAAYANIRRIAARAEDVDLPENHYDKIVAVFSVPPYSRYLLDYTTFIRKVMYSLKRGGAAVLVPMYPFFLRDAPNGRIDVDAELKKIRDSAGNKFSFNDDEVDIGPVFNSKRLIIRKLQ